MLCSMLGCLVAGAAMIRAACAERTKMRARAHAAASTTPHNQPRAAVLRPKSKPAGSSKRTNTKTASPMAAVGGLLSVASITLSAALLRSIGMHRKREQEIQGVRRLRTMVAFFWVVGLPQPASQPDRQTDRHPHHHHPILAPTNPPKTTTDRLQQREQELQALAARLADATQAADSLRTEAGSAQTNLQEELDSARRELTARTDELDRAKLTFDQRMCVCCCCCWWWWWWWSEGCSFGIDCSWCCRCILDRSHSTHLRVHPKTTPQIRPRAGEAAAVGRRRHQHWRGRRRARALRGGRAGAHGGGGALPGGLRGAAAH